MSIITMRPFQMDAIGRLRAAIAPKHKGGRGAKSVLLVSPTGSGKTRMFSWLTYKLVFAGKRTYVLDHRDELTEQISIALTDAGAKHGLIVAGASYYDPRVLAHVASVMTLNKRLDKVEVPDYVIVDEAHHCIEGSTWGRIIAYWRALNPNLIVIGVTATPERLGGEGLGSMFECMVLGPTTAELIADGWLSPYELFSPPGQADLRGVRKTGGDLNKGEAASRVDKPKITGNCVEHYRRLLDGAPTVSFCCSVAHAEHVADAFRAEGYRAQRIDGKMEKDMRRNIIRDFANGAINVLTSCDLISEGFDVPGIVGAILLRPTESLALYLQQVGRALRPMYSTGWAPENFDERIRAIAEGPKPKAILLDHVGNSGYLDEDQNFITKHGMPCDAREWDLNGREKKKRETDPDLQPSKRCPKCYKTSAQYVAKCACGHVFVVKSRVIGEKEGELQAVDIEAMRAAAKVAQGQAKTVDAMVEHLGYSEGRANHIAQARAEKDQLRSAALQASNDCYRACGGQRLSIPFIRTLKPKELKALIAASMDQIHEQALAMNDWEELA